MEAGQRAGLLLELAATRQTPYPYTADRQVTGISAVVEGLQLERVVLVVHDASGPPGRPALGLRKLVPPGQPMVNSTRGASLTHRGRMCSALAGSLPQLSMSIRYSTFAR